MNEINKLIDFYDSNTCYFGVCMGNYRNIKINTNMFLEVLNWFLVFLTVLLIYQVSKKLLGGSWTTEAVILTLLGTNIAITLALTVNIVKLGSNQEHLTKRFDELSSEVKFLNKDVINLERRFDLLEHKFCEFENRINKNFDQINLKLNKVLTKV